MNWKAIIGIGLIGTAAAGLYVYFNRQKVLLAQYGTQLIAFDFVKLTPEVVTVNLTVRFSNKSAIEATITKLYADVYLNGTFVGFVVNDGSFIVPAKGMSDIKVQLSFSPKLVLSNIVGLLFSSIGMKDVAYKMQGYAKVKSGGIITVTVPIDYSGTIKEFLKPSGV